MGFISSLIEKSGGASTFPGQGDGARRWREVFGTDKETPQSQSNKPKPTVPGGSWGRSATWAPSYSRLLQAMRSMAPGGWSDDRWEQTKHFVGISYVSIHRQNELLTEAEFQVFYKDENEPDGKRPLKKGDRGWELVELLEYPNREDSFGDLVAQWNLQMDLTGSALTWMVPNQMGKPFELYPIPTATAIPQPAVNPDFPDGYYRIQPVYPYGPFSSYPTPASAVGAPIPAQWMLRFKYPHPLLRYEGYSPLTAMRLHLDEIEQIDRSRWYSMKRSINPSAVLNMNEMEGGTQLPEEEIARIKAEFEAALMGSENAGQLFVASPGCSLDPWGGKPIEMDYADGWNQLADFAMAAFGITKPAAGMVESSSYATLYATLKQLYWITLEPKCARFGAKLTRHVAPFFGDNLIVEVRCKRLDDHEVKMSKLDRGMGAKCVTKNEVRKELEMPLTQDAWGADIAGDPSPKEQEQQQGAGGLPGAEEEINPVLGAEQIGDEEIERERPKPGKLSEGSLGPKLGTIKRLPASYITKVLNRSEPPPIPVKETPRKNWRDKALEVCNNGH